MKLRGYGCFLFDFCFMWSGLWCFSSHLDKTLNTLWALKTILNQMLIIIAYIRDIPCGFDKRLRRWRLSRERHGCSKQCSLIQRHCSHQLWLCVAWAGTCAWSSRWSSKKKKAFIFKITEHTWCEWWLEDTHINQLQYSIKTTDSTSYHRNVSKQFNTTKPVTQLSNFLDDPVEHLWSMDNKLDSWRSHSATHKTKRCNIPVHSALEG